MWIPGWVMSGSEAQLVRAIPVGDEAPQPRPVSDDSFETLRPYFRDIGPLETLAPDEEVALAREVHDQARLVRQEILGVPLAARLLVGRWCELRSGRRPTAALSALPPDRSDRWPPDASARIDDALQRVAILLDLRDKLHAHGTDTPSPAKLVQIDRQMQWTLLGADLSASLFDEILAVLREREALLGHPEASWGARLAVSRQEIGLSPAEFRERMQRIRWAEGRLQAARNELARRNLKLVVKMAKEFRGMGVPLPDLVQEGSLGVLHAVGKFDYRRGFKFSTYAVWWIRQAMVRAIQQQSRTVRLPSRVHDRSRLFRKAGARLATELGRKPTVEELARELGMAVKQVDRLMRASLKQASLDAPVAEAGGESLGDLLEDPHTPNPVEELARAQLARTVDSLLPRLSDRERDILTFRFGLNGEPALTLRETAERIGLSCERVRQVQEHALLRLRHGAMAAP